MTTDITELAQSEINDALAQLKQISEYPTPSTQYARVLRKYILALLEALEKAQQVDEELCKLLSPGVEYMDPPDGGDVEPIEQVRRMVADYRQRIAELESRTVTIEPFRSFVTDADLAALHRFAECCDDPESGGHDLEKEQVRRLEEIGALRRHGRVHWITGFGDVLISITSGIKWEAE
ncbi:TPA: hypothetical protein ACXPG9_001978 [Klebsiella pneumoniae]|uniref:hypothetical protein n=1 Tax=Klebsiella pneumoniae TaxID=573 RepID=UPI000C7A82E5|nr:hypothetical protein [Klebsiella pneumoniae]ELA2661674.1 hypothetical protein [Klebsiella pneumoniae]MCP6029188.1 hypothetical protein [Klebsiella pneumoniae]MDZ5895164.1 hypothetical protein [Klebsiella pneumoniae]UNM36231.1 hypothetical protein CLR01_14150 [Klebsiella pneumoniae subsp. pneumoniae]HBQ3062929.1 hypothetical protein [Klebsiella pneumoniae]